MPFKAPRDTKRDRGNEKTKRRRENRRGRRDQETHQEHILEMESFRYLRELRAELGGDLEELSRGELVLARVQLRETGDHLQLGRGDGVELGSLFRFADVVDDVRVVVKLNADLWANEMISIRSITSPKNHTLITFMHIWMMCREDVQ
jgi:hypothetical protein